MCSIESSKPDVPRHRLSDGSLNVPLIGYGTCKVVNDATLQWFGKEFIEAYEAMKTAIGCGYRFIDTAAYYRNENLVGQAVTDCIEEGVCTREEIIVSTKLWCTNHKRAAVMEACKYSLERFELDYIDIYLMHWPMAYADDEYPIDPIHEATGRIIYSDTHFTETWLGMQDCLEAGLVKTIGLSNFNRSQIQQILDMPCKHKPTINQVECHPYLSQEKLQQYCTEQDIVLHAYCPFGAPNTCKKNGLPDLFLDKLVLELAEKYHKTSAQILLRYLTQRNIACVPKTMWIQRMQENLESANFQISQDDMTRLMGLNRNLRYHKHSSVDVSDHPLYPFHDEY